MERTERQVGGSLVCVSFFPKLGHLNRIPSTPAVVLFQMIEYLCIFHHTKHQASHAPPLFPLCPSVHPLP